MQAPPLCLSDAAALDCAAYRARRVLPGWASCLKLDARESGALSNWRVSGDSKSQSMAASMQMLYDQSKVTQQCISKFLCIIAMLDTVSAANDFNLTWPEYFSRVKPKEEYEEMAKDYSIGLLPPEGVSKARQESAKLPFTPADLAESFEKRPGEEPSNTESS